MSNPVYQIIISGLITIAIYLPMLVKLVNQWSTDENYSHGFLIPIITAYLIYEKREKLKELEFKPTHWGLGLVFVGLGIYLFGVIGADLFTQRFSFLVVLIGSILCLFGSDVFKEISFPLFYLFFMIPIPYVIFFAIAAPLKLFVAEVAVNLLKTAGLPIMRVGNKIYLPNAQLTVAYACSGLRSLISLIALGAVFGYVTQKIAWKRLVIFALTVPIAIMANIVRILITCLVAFVYGEEIATGFLHDFSGMLVFGVAVFLLIFTGGLMWEGNKPTSIS